ncbi:MAG TPA: agglutinin biogenesis protein [Gallionella sp.]|jgi:MSHA biogenesis protein MshJ|nr:agglutinin biogenesis protein [Gallionella sp.]OGS66425.1 MAG: agglutinin biogenesis protein [Gallionellales bacterium GWA2_54_124]OGT18610.1 MAG: agglutinin biogenesis protein [Gallionellales bacterium RIFOXYD12_FULL_53_10]OGT34690.1 MAG: agglutinin biogenesis protein [Gallionellales bacterium RIFOXYD2_FULL_52_7]HCI52608.1 agglutinin biogenesis protein [Gallionella sp.]
MKKYWELTRVKVDAMSTRERAMIFSAAVGLLILLLNALLLDPLLVRQKAISLKMAQQEQETNNLQQAIKTILQAKQDIQHSPLRVRISELKGQIQENENFLKERSARLVEPGKMAELLEQVLSRNDKLQLVELKTLPLSLLLEQKTEGKTAAPVYKHGVQITVRGDYLDLLRYLTALENMPIQMFWGEVSLSVAKHPDSVLTLTVYTLSLDKTWLTV